VSEAWLQVCENESAVSLTVGACCADVTYATASPIDDYYSYVEHLLTLGDAAALQGSETLGRLLLLGLVSGVEAYFRAVLAGALRVCPVSRANAADHMIPFGAIDYYGVDEIELGLFDAASLAGADEIKKGTKKLLGIDVHASSSVDVALREFDKVCHLRHAAVHARGTLGRGNASALGFASDEGRRSLKLDLPALHQAGTVCHSTVRAYNRFLYEKLVRRWRKDGLFAGSWDADGSAFQPLFELFRSKRDAVGPKSAYSAYRSLVVALHV
jgi:hypothetical protein